MGLTKQLDDEDKVDCVELNLEKKSRNRIKGNFQ